MEGTTARKFNVGGVLLDRPFKLRRLGHFGFNAVNFDACMRFYTDLLGFSLSDPIDFGSRIEDEAVREGFETTVGWFMRHGGDHHSFVLFPKPVLDHIGGRSAKPDMTVNQITWQVGSLREVTEAEDWLRGRDTRIRRSGRDTPGSNWHVYPYDPDEHLNELYYGIEQIGWDGFSKPGALHEEKFAEQPGLPQISEYAEVERARAHGTDLASGYRHEQTLEATYDVGGVLLPRPFKVVRIGPVRLFVEDVDEAVYRVDRMMTTLKLAGVLDRIAGFIFGRCTDCDPGSGFGSLTLEQVLEDHIAPLGIPAFRGSMIGHIPEQFTLPIGGRAEMDADGGTIRLLEPAVL